MKDPIRLRDSTSGASNGVRTLLDSARKTRQMTDVERARMVAHGAKIASMPATGSVIASPALVGTGKLVAGIVVVIAGAKGILPLFSSTDNNFRENAAPIVEMVRPDIPPDLVLPETAPSATAITAPDVPEVSLAPAPAASTVVIRSAKPISSARIEMPPAHQEVPPQIPEQTEQEGDELTREARRLSEATRLLATNPSEALERLEAHRLAFPRGKLGLEREVIVMDALIRVGRVQEARARGDALLARAKGSFYEARVRRMMETMNP